MPRTGLIERAFELARSGDCRSLAEVRARLNAEHYEVSTHLDGRVIRRQIAEAIRQFCGNHGSTENQ